MLEDIINGFWRILKWLKSIIILVVILGALVFFLGVGTYVDRQSNGRILKDELPLTLSEEAKRLHGRLVIADWHADNLLWARNPLDQLGRGHVDVPRLIEGNVTLQVFDAVTKMPRGLNYESNGVKTDNLIYLAMANRWPIGTWFNLTNRALHQSSILHEAAKKSSALTLIKTSDDLDIFVKLRKHNTTKVAGLLSVQGLHTLRGNLDNVDVLYDAGFRIMGLVHFFDNEVGGSSFGEEKSGLTQFGKEVIQRMNNLDIIIDLAYASPQLFEEALRFSSRPVIVSHTGVKATFDSASNLTDDQLRAIASKGGMIGIGFSEHAVGSTSVEAITQAIKHAVSIAGADHVGLGSGFDGANTLLFDASQLVMLTDGLLRAGFSEEDIRKIMGENQIRFLLENLPT